jgi:AcrR family transcriptional regulator
VVSVSGEVLPPEGDPEACGRQLRSDARKNRARLLEAAEEVFAEKGIAVPIDDVARRAGVGVGTLYRHFPTKEALFAAVVTTRLEHLRDESRCLLDNPDPGGALFVFAKHLGEQAAAKHDLADALAEAGIDVKADMADVMDEMNVNVQELISRAQECGTIRDDLSAKELFGLVVGSCLAAHHQGLDAEAQQRLIGVVFDGMRRVAG